VKVKVRFNISDLLVLSICSVNLTPPYEIVIIPTGLPISWIITIDSKFEQSFSIFI